MEAEAANREPAGETGGPIEALRQRLETLVREAWSKGDPDAEVFSVLRGPAQIDMRVVSRLFEGKDGLEREAFFYPVFETVSKSDMLHMTYCLLLTPQEAARAFAAPDARAGRDNVDAWE